MMLKVGDIASKDDPSNPWESSTEKVVKTARLISVKDEEVRR